MFMQFYIFVSLTKGMELIQRFVPVIKYYNEKLILHILYIFTCYIHFLHF